MRFYLLKLSLYLVLGMLLLKLPVLEPFVDDFCLLLAKIVASTLGLFDAGIERHGNIVFRNTYGYALAISRACGAFGYTMVIVSATLALPISIIQRFKAILLLSLAFQLINIVRLITLVYAKVLFNSKNFDILHEQFWPFLLTILATFIFYLSFRSMTNVDTFTWAKWAK